MTSEAERKARTRRLIELGGLVVVAGADGLDKPVLVGALLEAVRALSARKDLAPVLRRAGVLQMEQKTNDRRPDLPALRVSFALAPSVEVRDGLKALGFSFDDERTWFGHGDPEAVRSIARGGGGVVRQVDHSGAGSRGRESGGEPTR